MNEEEKLGVGNINLLETFYQPIKDQQKLYGDKRYSFFKENQIDPAELIGIQRDPNASLLGLKKDDPDKEENNSFFAKDLVNFISDIPDQSIYRLTLGGMNAARFGVNLLPTITRLIGSEPGEDRFDDMTKFSVDVDNKLKTGIETFKQVYKQGFEAAKGREPSSGADLLAYVAQDYPYAAPIYKALNKIGLPATYAIPLSVGLSSGIAFDPKTDESSLFFDSAAIQGLKTYFNALPNTPEGEVFDRAYQSFEGTGLAAFVGPIINTALFLKKNVPAFNKATPGAAVATGSATAIGEVTNQTILNPEEDQNVDMQNQDQSLMDTIKGGIDQFGNKLTEIGGAIKKEFSGAAMANPLIVKGANELAPIFKSTVIDAIEKIPNKAPVEQISGIIKNTLGVTQQELKWIGLDDFLKTKSNQKFIDKQELADFIQANRIDVNEVKLGGELKLNKDFEKRKSEFETKFRDLSTGDTSFIGYDTYPIKYQEFGFNEGFQKSSVTRMLDFNQTDGIMLQVINATKLPTETSRTRFANDFFETSYVPLSDKTQPSFIDKYKETLEDGSESFVLHKLFDKVSNIDKYTDTKTAEMLLTSDRFEKVRIIYFEPIEIEKYLIEREYRAAARSAGGTRFKTFTEPGGRDYTELVLTVNQQGKSNLPVEMQNSIGTDVVGRSKTTMPYTSPGAHFGQKNEIAHVRFKTRDVKGQKILSVEELQSDLINQMQAGDFVFAKPKKTMDDFDLTEQSLKDFPFKNTWHELVTRRLIRHAADNGFDAISFPKSVVTLRRYNMLDSVRNVSITRARDGDVANNSIQLVFSKGEEKFVNNIDELKKYFQDDEIVDLKNFLEKRLSPENRKEARGFRTETTSFPDMDVAVFTPKRKVEILPTENTKGAGRVEFYDKVIPSYLKKYAKKWNAPVYEDVIDLTKEVAEQGTRRDSMPVTILKITPEMKRSVQDKSQPLFNVVLPALTGAGGAKAVSDSMRNNTISEPTKNQ